MTESTVQIDSSLQRIMEEISVLGREQKQVIWELLDEELFPENECSPEELADIEAARADYEAGEYITFEQYKAERNDKNV